MATSITMSGVSFCGLPFRQGAPAVVSLREMATGVNRNSSRSCGYGEGVKMAAADGGKALPYASYAVPLEASKEPSLITRPLVEILRDMNKRVPVKVLKTQNDNGVLLKYIPWYHANKMLSFYAPGWSGEV